MRKILQFNVIDLVPFSKGIIFVKRDTLPDGTNKASFHSFDVFSEEITTVTKSVYLRSKFGDAYQEISNKLGDFISCETAKLPNRNIIVMYPTGEMGHFDEKGRIVKTGDLYYDGAPARDCAFDGGGIWCAVPERNAVIKYSLTAERILLRIGGGDNTAFNTPVSASFYNDEVFVCNSGSREIRRIDVNTLNVSDYVEFSEPVNKYLRFKNKEIVALKSGIYMI